MDFGISQDLNDLTRLARDILTSREWSGAGFDPELWRELGKAGVLAAALPEAAGGAGLGLQAHCGVLTELGRVLAPAPYLTSIALAADAIATFGTPEQRQRWAEPAARGDLLLTVAVPDAGRGYCDAVPAAPWADAFLVPVGGRVAIRERPDVRVEAQELTDGVTAGRVTVDDGPVPADRILDADGVVDWLGSRGIVGVCAHQLGVCERAVELTAEHARTRVAFGRPIGTFQAVAQRVADAWIDLEAIRLTMWQAAWQLESGTADTEVSTAKFWAADAGHRIAHTAVHIHGGIGIDVSYPLHRYFAAAKTNEFALGSATDHLRRIGTALAR